MTGTIQYERGADGVVLLTIDVPDQAQNVITDAFAEDFIGTVERLRADEAATGAILASGKDSFMAGADLKGLERLIGEGLDVAAVRLSTNRFKSAMRRLETWGKPVAAVIAGHALGGGFELCLACHRRFAADDASVLLGLPEVTVGLLPGGGGTQRLLRLVGVAGAMDPLLKGAAFSPHAALELGMVDEVAPRETLVARARAWILQAAEVRQPWDRPGFEIPGGFSTAGGEIANLFVAANARVHKETLGLYPAPRAILACLFEGAPLPIDAALDVETEHFLSLLVSPVAGAIIRTSFLNRKSAEKLRARPPGIAPSQFSKLGVVGAGLMGAGIACVAAQSGLEVTLIDRDQGSADRGKAYTSKALAARVDKGFISPEQADAILQRVVATTDYEQLRGAELVIEAVFEDEAVKASVTKAAEAVLNPTAVMASNTSTLPISGLASASARPLNFIGLHFFSPVERMALVEVICGVQTSSQTLARALDFVRRIRKTPIVVKDSRGFYTSRVFGTFTSEGLSLLHEGVDPALIENAARMAGMPIGPLALLDEVALELVWKVVCENRRALGEAYSLTPGDAVVDVMVNELRRGGRRSGGGFYDYPAGAPKRIWSGLRERFPAEARQPSLAAVKERLLFRQAVEAARCVAEGIVTPADADLGALLGWGFPAWTGGPMSLIDNIGVARFVDICDGLAANVDGRFTPPDTLRSGRAAADGACLAALS